MYNQRSTSLPVDSTARKGVPLVTGCYNYFPAALAGVAMHSVAGNNTHNPGEPLHHARGKSMDHADCVGRHMQDAQDMLAAIDRGEGKVPSDERIQALLAEANALCWRALAFSQDIHERFGGAPPAPAAKLPSMLDAMANAVGKSNRDAARGVADCILTTDPEAEFLGALGRSTPVRNAAGYPDMYQTQIDKADTKAKQAHEDSRVSRMLERVGQRAAEDISPERRIKERVSDGTFREDDIAPNR